MSFLLRALAARRSHRGRCITAAPENARFHTRTHLALLQPSYVVLQHTALFNRLNTAAIEVYLIYY
jgi:hypothetical protein